MLRGVTPRVEPPTYELEFANVCLVQILLSLPASTSNARGLFFFGSDLVEPPGLWRSLCGQGIRSRYAGCERSTAALAGGDRRYRAAWRSISVGFRRGSTGERVNIFEQGPSASSKTQHNGSSIHGPLMYRASREASRSRHLPARQLIQARLPVASRLQRSPALSSVCFQMCELGISGYDPRAPTERGTCRRRDEKAHCILLLHELPLGDDRTSPASPFIHVYCPIQADRAL